MDSDKMRKLKRLVMMVLRDIAVLAMSLALFAHVYYIWRPSWWSLMWDVAWVVLYLISLGWVLTKNE